MWGKDDAKWLTKPRLAAYWDCLPFIYLSITTPSDVNQFEFVDGAQKVVQHSPCVIAHWAQIAQVKAGRNTSFHVSMCQDFECLNKILKRCNFAFTPPLNPFSMNLVLKLLTVLWNTLSYCKEIDMKKWYLLGLVFALAFGFQATGPVEGVDQPKEAPKKPLTVMQRKLLHARAVLEGLAMNDFAKIKSGSDGMMECAREASWRVLTTPKYELYSNDFIRHLEEMQTAAKNKNLEAASLAYVETTLTCIKCHQHVREERVGQILPNPVSPTSASLTSR